MNLIKNLLEKFFINKNEKDLKKIRIILEKIKQKSKNIISISNDELRNNTEYLKNYIKKATYDIVQQKNNLINEIQENSSEISIIEKLNISLDKVKKQIYNEEKKILNKILPESFAIIKETAKRFKEKKNIIVTATNLDIELSKTKSYVILDRNKAIWNNTWKVCGKKVHWDMVHYDVQLMGGVVLHQGKISEMATGEGKTFVATLSAYLNALTGKGVHIVTVNSYLSKRDSEWMAPLMEFHGLKVDCIDNYSSSNIKMRKQAYLADITYGTNNEFGFDYLRDNMSCNKKDIVQRELNYAIIDEIDSVLIDEARTPLIISGPVNSQKDNKEEYEKFQHYVKILVDKQNEKVNNLINTSKKLIKTGDIKNGGFKLFQSYRGLPKKESLIKFLSEKSIRIILKKVEISYLQDYGKEMYKVDKELYFVIDEKNNTVEFTDKGIEFLSQKIKNDNFFVLPDVNGELVIIEHKKLSKHDKDIQKEELLKNFSIKSQRIHVINQLLRAYTLFEKDIDYLVLNNKVQIVDEQTGRIMQGRRYSDGLHQAIEAKENVNVESSSQTCATITLQNYFRMYRKISGMTGTAETESGEFWYIYKLDVVVIPTHYPIQRIDFQDLVFKTKREKYNAIIEKIINLSVYNKRPVLVGTTSVEVSEFLSKALKFRKISHNVLNAKVHEKEAYIISKAGLSGSVTIATNMAGRGTDIKLCEEVVKNGGLSVIGTERHDSRRVDNQLRGRAGRQGDPGSTQFYISLEDDLIRVFFDSEKLSRLMDRFGHKKGDIIQHPLLTKSIAKAQKKIEENNFSIRKRLLDYDDVINKQREFIYKKRRRALFEKNLIFDISNMIYVLLDIMSFYENKKLNKNLFNKLFKIFGFNIYDKNIKIKNKLYYINNLHNVILNFYKKRRKKIILKEINPIIYDFFIKKNIMKNINNYQIQITFSYSGNNIKSISDLDKIYNTQCESLFLELERETILYFMDDKWKEHLRDMDCLRNSVQNAVFEQKDPLLVYKQNAFNLFQEKIYKVYQQTLSFLFNFEMLKSNVICIPKVCEVRKYDKIHRKIGRNEKINIRHLLTGEKKNMKFKQAELLLENGEWIIENII